MHKSISIIKPKKLEKGDTIGLVCPAGFISQKQLEQAKNILLNLGFNSFNTNVVLKRKGYLAGDDIERAEDLNAMFVNENIDAILSVRGGYGSSRILKLVDYELIRRNPKIFIGYSDITALLNSIYKFSGLITFHGIVGISDFDDYTKQNFIDLFVNETAIIKSEKSIQPHEIYSGTTSGKLVGGNLSLLVSLLATDFEIDFTDKIVFIEEIGEAPYKIDRMLTQLLLAGKFQKAKAIVLGVFKNCDFNNDDITTHNSLSLHEVIVDRLKFLNIPIISNFSFGHIKSQAVLPIGLDVEIDTNKMIIKLLENPFK